LVADNAQLAALKAAARNPDAFGFLEGGYPGASYALMLRKDDPQILDIADRALSEAAQSGEYAKLYAKWFENPIPPKNVNLAYPMPAKLKEALKVDEEKTAGR
jgi:glutamate/aspartate transport system substrate-binding protein